MSSAAREGRASARPAGVWQVPARMQQLELYAKIAPRRVVVLVGCGATKAPKACKAKDLYVGNLFRAARLYAERRGLAWRILSAKYGLLDPETQVQPYNMRLHNGERQRAFWANGIAGGLIYSMKSSHLEVICLAGADYADPVCHMLEQHGIPCSKPLQGLQVGERLAWFKSQLESEVQP